MEEQVEVINPGLEDISKQANQIKDSIRNLERELDALQNNCNHPEYDIKNCPTQSCCFQLKRVCKKCLSEIGYPTSEETEAWVSS